MKTKTFEQEQKTIQVHTFEPHESCFPFTIVEENIITSDGNEERTYAIALGKQKVDKKTYRSFNEAVDEIERKPYHLIIALIYETINIFDEWEKEQIELLKTEKNENNE